MHDVTLRLVELLEQDISKQRLDSTHVFSDMATFGRTRLMGVTIKRFLTQVKRGDSERFNGRSTFKTLRAVFEQQCEVVDRKVSVKAKTGGGTMSIGDFEVDQETQTVEKRPAGHAPERSIHDPETGKTRTEMAPEICGACEMQERCPMK